MTFVCIIFEIVQRKQSLFKIACSDSTSLESMGGRVEKDKE